MLAPVPGYINAKVFTEAGEICEQVFQSYKYASDPVMAETLTYLHTCCINGYPVPKAFSSIEDIEKQAYYYGSIYSSQKEPILRRFLYRQRQPPPDFLPPTVKITFLTG